MIVVFGSVNLDLIFPLATLPRPGQTVLGAAMTRQPGGKGANQAVAAARDGALVVFAGAVGRDFLAEEALALLAGAGVDLTRIARVDFATGCAAICVDRAGENLIAVASGANLAARQDQIEDRLLGPGTTVLLQMETPTAEIAALIRRARGAGARILLNLAPAAALPPAVLQAVDILLLNEGEAEFLAEAAHCPPTAAALHAALGVEVVRTLGAAGVEAAGKAGPLHLEARPIIPVDTTAAGDCFAGVLAAGLDRGLALEAALARANVAAGLCCTAAGSQSSLPWAQSINAALPTG